MSEKEITVEEQLSNIETAADTIFGSLKKAQASSNLYICDSIMDAVGEDVEHVKTLADSSQVIVDKYGNSLSSVGTEDKVNTFTSYGFSADTLNWPLWLALYNDSWVFRRAIDKPATDEIAAGFTIHGDRDYSKVYKAYNSCKAELANLLKWGALYGGSVAVFIFDGIKKEEMSRPLDKARIKGRKFKLYVTDRWYGVSPTVNDLVGNMKDIDYGKPKYYTITFADGKEWKVHHSYILRYEHRTAPNLIKNGYLQGWGYAEGAHIINELARDDQLKSSITSLVNKALIEVIKMAGMRGVFMGTDKGSELQLRKRLEMVNWGRTYNSLTFLDKDDEYQQYQLTGLSGLAELMEKNMWLIAAALEMQGILFGDLKGGLSQESDAFARYSQTIYNRCDTNVRPVLKKFLSIVYIIYDIKDNKGKYETPDFDFEYLDKYERNKLKVDAIKNIADMLSKLEQDGIVSKYQYAVTVRDYANTDKLNLIFTKEILNKLKLEEEQAILDTLKDIGKKRNKKLAMNNNGQINTSSPFSEEEYESSEEVEEPLEEVGTEEVNTETTTETEQPQVEETPAGGNENE